MGTDVVLMAVTAWMAASGGPAVSGTTPEPTPIVVTATPAADASGWLASPYREATADRAPELVAVSSWTPKPAVVRVSYQPQAITPAAPVISIMPPSSATPLSPPASAATSWPPASQRLPVAAASPYAVPSATSSACSCAPAVAGQTAYLPHQAVTAYRPVTSVGLGAPETAYIIGRGIYGQPTVYVPGQPLRNFLRYLSP